MSNKQLSRWSGDFGGEYTKRNVGLNFSPERMRKHAAIFEEIFQQTEGIRSILEVGCNTGHNLLTIANLGAFELVGIDPEVSALKIGKSRGVPAPLLKGSSFDIPFFDGYFDLVFTFGVLMHIRGSDLLTALKEINRVTNKYFCTLDYFDETETEVHDYHGYDDMLWRRDIGRVISDHFPQMALIHTKPHARDPKSGKYTVSFLFEKK